jgi:multidrug efflux pump subunit AcrB
MNGASVLQRTAIILGFAVLFACLLLVALYESWTIPVPVLLLAAIGILGSFGAIVTEQAAATKQAHTSPPKHIAAE